MKTSNDSSNSSYASFCKKWEIENIEKVERLYDLESLKSFLPDFPTEEDKKALKSVLGVAFDHFYGYIDYQKSTNTFELIMQWREKTGKFE